MTLKPRKCPKCGSGLCHMMMNERQELVQLVCHACGETLGTNKNGVLTLNQAGYIGELIHAVERNLKLRYLPGGAKDDGRKTLTVELRAFTYNGGALYPSDADIRDAYVWCSGVMEHWYKVSDLIAAMQNAIDGSYGLDAPMAVIDDIIPERK
jgi:hypothetical protein